MTVAAASLPVMWASFRQSPRVVQTTPVWEYHWSGTTADTVSSVPPTVARLPACSSSSLARLAPITTVPSATGTGARPEPFGPEDCHAGRPGRRAGGAKRLEAALADAQQFGVRNTLAGGPLRQLSAGDLGLGERRLGAVAGGSPEDDLVRRQCGEGRRRLVAQTGREAGEQHQQQGDERDDSAHQNKASFGEAEVAESEIHGSPFHGDCGLDSSLPLAVPGRHRPRGWACRAEWLTRRSTKRLIVARRQGFRPDPARPALR